MIANDRKSSFDIFCGIAEEFAPSMNDYLFVYDVPNDTCYITEQATKRFKLPSNVIRNPIQAAESYVYPDDLKLFYEDMHRIISGEQTAHNLEYRWIGRNGSPIWINGKGRLLYDADGSPDLLVGCVNEIGQKARADNVSGLLGESSLREHFHCLDSDLSDVVLLRIGIDDFKIINERHGSQYGDYVLREVADCICSSLEPGQLVYHMMSDEFMILDLYGSDSKSMEQLYQQICFRVEASVAKQHYKALYTISAGLLRLRDIAPDARGDYVEAMKLSEFALSEAKNRGKNRMYSYRSEDYTAFLRKRHIRTNMSQALSDNYRGFEVYYQPIINPQLGSLYAAEALLRFHSPSGETTGPSEFVPVLEESGLIVPVGKWIIRQALDMCREVRTVYPDFKVSVNLSYIQIMKFPLYEEVMAALEEAGLPPSSLIVEMTESGQLEGDSAARDIWRKLKASGVNIALDDFGTGYSNLTNIGDLRPDYLKIDHVFTTRALRSEYEFELLRHVVNMAHSIGLNLVVEGVETLDELIRILQLNPDFIQGFFYCSPCPRAEFFTKYHI